MKFRILAASMIAGIAAYALPAAAQIGPVPSGWSCTGNCGTDTADGVVGLSPHGSSSYQWISTAAGPSGVGQIAGIGGTNGSVLTTPVFTALSGDPLQFYFNFVTSDGAIYADYAWSALFNASDNSIAAYLFTARTEPSGNISPGAGLPANASTLIPPTSGIAAGGPAWGPLAGSSGTCFDAGCGYTGWIESLYNIPTSGDYYVGFGTTNWLDTAYQTGMAIDGVTVNNVEIPTGTPEPASLVLFASGLLGLRAMRRRLG